MPATDVYEAYSVPRQHGQRLIAPSLEVARRQLPKESASNESLFELPLEEVRHQARHELVEAACAHTNRYLTIGCQAEHQRLPVVLAGHQPGLFHPGVWLKNFALSGFQPAAQSINILIDNDTVKSPSIRVPRKEAGEVRLTSVAYDRLAKPIPHEEWQVQDSSLFQSFGDRVQESLDSLHLESMMQSFWQRVLKVHESMSSVGEAIAAARHQLEHEWGLQSLEVPLSTLTQTEAFYRFVTEIIIRAETFREIYNSALQSYRDFHRIRSRSHPVPNLFAKNEQIELPFWIWDQTTHDRDRLILKSTPSGLSLGTESRVWPLPQGRTAITQRLKELTTEGVRIRPRALTTTMFCRLILCDLFIHGIGGAKYDQVTTHIMRDFWRVDVAPFMVVTGTACLNIPHEHVPNDALQKIHNELRILTFNPQKVLAASGAADDLVAAKRNWINNTTAPGRERHQQILKLNREMQPYVASQRKQLEARKHAVADRLKEQKIIESREFPFCIFSEDSLRPLLDQLSKP